MRKFFSRIREWWENWTEEAILLFIADMNRPVPREEDLVGKEEFSVPRSPLDIQ